MVLLDAATSVGELKKSLARASSIFLKNDGPDSTSSTNNETPLRDSFEQIRGNVLMEQRTASDQATLRQLA